MKTITKTTRTKNCNVYYLGKFLSSFLVRFFSLWKTRNCLNGAKNVKITQTKLSVTNIWNRYFVSVASLENSNLGNSSFLVSEFLAYTFFWFVSRKDKNLRSFRRAKKVTIYLQLQSNLSATNKSHKRACLLMRGAKKVTHGQK